MRDLNRLYTGDPVLSANDCNVEGFRWINCNDTQQSVLSFLRLDATQDKIYLVVGNFTPVTRAPYAIGVPRAGYWREVLNTDAASYGGSGNGNHGGRQSEEKPADGYAHRIEPTLPGLTTLVFQWVASAASVTPADVAAQKS